VETSAPPTGRRPLLALSPEELEREVERLGGRAFHARILRRAVLGQGLLDVHAMTSLPLRLREALAESFEVLSARELARTILPIVTNSRPPMPESPTRMFTPWRAPP